MRKVVLILLLVAPILYSQITVDGDPSEWGGTAPIADNSALYSEGTAGTITKYNEWIWKDASGDHRTDFSGAYDGAVNASGQDIVELRLASDGTSLFILAKFSDIVRAYGVDGAVSLLISLDIDQDGSGTSYLGSNSDTQVESSALWEYQIIPRTGTGSNNNLVWTESYSSSSNVGALAYSTTNETIEISIPWSELGGVPAASDIIRFSFSSFRANGTTNEAWDTGGDNSKGDVLDFLTTTSGNTYAALIGVSNGGTNNEGRLDDFQDIEFISGGQALPVELTSFSALSQSNTVNLSWETATEVNNYGFEIERTITNSKLQIPNWENVGFVEGHGNSNSAKQYSYVDNSVRAGQSYSYRLKQIDFDGQFEYSSVVNVEVGVPMEFNLAQNYPNPFNPSTSIEYSVPSNEFVTLKVYDVLGNTVSILVNETKEAGKYNVSFDASNLTSGIYFYSINAGGFTQVKKMMLVK